MKLFGAFSVLILIAGGFLEWTPALALSEQEIEARRAALQAELEREEQEIAATVILLQAKQREGATLQGEVDLLQAKISRARASIRSKQAEINRLGDEINYRELKIGELDAKIIRQQESLAEMLRRTREHQRISLAEVVLGSDSLTEFFSDVDNFTVVQKSLHTSFDQMREAQAEARREQEFLARQRAQEADAKAVIEEEEERTRQLEEERTRVLRATRNEEKTYQQVLEERQRRAAEIRAQLFSLRDTAPIPFGRALEYANLVYEKVGIRPAFLLAIIEQESNMGQNVGTCNRPGDPPSKHWTRIMHPTRDQGPFVRILQELGLSPEGTPLSCPFGGGYGGAMGPAQFIPSTWETVKAEVSALVGKIAPNPWEPLDAFAASGVYLARLGGAAGGYTAERTAALKYYAGSNWNKAKNAFYGDQVMERAQRIQVELIEPLQNL